MSHRFYSPQKTKFMANLKEFMSKSLKSGSPVDLYVYRYKKIGNGIIEELKDHYLRASGMVNIPGTNLKASSIIIEMPDDSPSGECKITLNGFKFSCPYHIEKDTLIFERQSIKFYLKNNDGKWTWLYVGQEDQWVGIWPAKHLVEPSELHPEFLESAEA